MNISFQKLHGDCSRGIVFFWRMAVVTNSPLAITDHFIPELFFDYFFVKEGNITCIDQARSAKHNLPRQVFKTIHTRPLTLVLSTPLVIYGARFSLTFAESFWNDQMSANLFQRQAWVNSNVDDLETFKNQIMEYVQKHQKRKWPDAMLSPSLQESGWLVHFSPRHKRRLYKATFGLSRKELQSIHNLRSFLEQTCDFEPRSPRIIQHVNPEVFYDQPHLNHTFKKMTGLAPVEYFQANSILQDHLMSASYNERSGS